MHEEIRRKRVARAGRFDWGVSGRGYRHTVGISGHCPTPETAERPAFNTVIQARRLRVNLDNRLVHAAAISLNPLCLSHDID
jgi:hypothetical protein